MTGSSCGAAIITAYDKVGFTIIVNISCANAIAEIWLISTGRFQAKAIHCRGAAIAKPGCIQRLRGRPAVGTPKYHIYRAELATNINFGCANNQVFYPIIINIACQ